MWVYLQTWVLEVKGQRTTGSSTEVLHFSSRRTIYPCFSYVHPLQISGEMKLINLVKGRQFDFKSNPKWDYYYFYYLSFLYNLTLIFYLLLFLFFMQGPVGVLLLNCVISQKNCFCIINKLTTCKSFHVSFRCILSFPCCFTPFCLHICENIFKYQE